MNEKDIRARLDELDAELSVAHSIALGGYWPATAMACAMLNAGLIDKVALLKIVDTLSAIAAALAVASETDSRYSAFVLEAFRCQLEQMDLKPGCVLTELDEIEQGAAAMARFDGDLIPNQRKEKD